MEEKRDDEQFVPENNEHTDDTEHLEINDAKVINDFHSHHKENRKKGPSSLNGLLNKRSAGILCLILLAVAGGVMLMQFKKDPPAPATQAESRVVLGVVVSLIDGTAKYSKDGQSWDKLTTETAVAEGDWLSADAASRVILTLDDGSIVRLDESSTISLSNLSADNVVVSNESGDVYVRVVTSDRSFIVAVDETNYSAQGTAYLTINETTQKGVQVLQSTVKVENVETAITEGKQFYKEHANIELKDKVTDISVDELKSSSFMVWNLEQDKQSEEFKDKLGYLTKIEETPEPEPEPAPASASIKLTGKVAAEKGVTLNWTVNNIGSVEGFKIVRSKKTTTPTYGKDEASFASGSSTRTYTWKDGSGVTYNYRVCAYKGKTCTVYSNSISLTSPYLPPTPVTDGTMTLDITDMVANWTFTGTAPHGYKLVVGNDGSTPTISDHIKKIGVSSSPYDFASSGLTTGNYSVRVCAYTASYDINYGCSNYSDTKTLVIP
jgi:hypothetical protein